MTQTVQTSGAVPPVSHVSIGQVVAERLIRPLYQPIVDLSTRTMVGLEALARGPAGTPLEFPDRLFAAARDAGCYGELDMLCAERAVECGLTAPVPPPLLFINAEPGVLDQPVSSRMLEMVYRGLPFRKVLEFTERGLPAVPGSMLRLAGRLQGWGHSIALDDVGVDPMSLFFLPVLEPEVIKLDMSLVRNPHAPATQAVCAVVRAEALRTGAVVIAEGIETEDDLVAARGLGAAWGQGWLFGRPEPIAQANHPFDHAAASVLRAPRPEFHQPAGTPFQVAASRGPVVTGATDSVTAAVTRLRHVLAADDGAAVVVVSFPDTGFPGVAVSLQELAGKARSVILLDDPVPGEFAAVIVGGGYGRAVCARSSATLEIVDLDHLPTVAAVARNLLNRHR